MTSDPDESPTAVWRKFAELKRNPQSSVFLNYTQKQLDDAYDQRVWAKNAEDVIGRYGIASSAVREKYKPEVRSYGANEDAVLDVFAPARTSGAGAPVQVFIHGGAWRSGCKEMYSFPAPNFVEHGAVYIAVGFSTIPKVRMPEMAHQIRSAIVWIYKNARSLGGDPERIFISGHSSGGHLCGAALVTDWSQYGVPPTLIKGGLVVSGIYDLHPVLLSERNSYITITPEEEHDLSPQRHLERITCPVIIAYGDGESPEFNRQARDLAAELKSSGKYPSELIELQGMNHFEVIETLADGILGKVALRQMGLLTE